jgi:EAL domain-containing protein (putative c-di-GMP-specific phosphodiesterase class I)
VQPAPALHTRGVSEEEQPASPWNDTPSRLRKALKQDEFVLFCQPILALRGNGGFALAEVLIRLREEEQALLPPGEFLPLFEQHEMMPLLDRWVLVRIVQRIAAGCRVARLAMNVSGQTLLDAEFPGFFAETVKRSKIPPAAVVFEVDERDLVGRPQAVKRFAERMRSTGGGLAVSGFGRRLDSFDALEAMRPDFVKVDGSIILKILKSATSEGLLKAVLRVGASLRIGVVAECVEDQDTLTRLVSLGVGYAQGFGVTTPRPLEQLSPRFKAADAA